MFWNATLAKVEKKKNKTKSKTPNCGSETWQVPFWSVHKSVLYRNADGGSFLFYTQSCLL